MPVRTISRFGPLHSISCRDMHVTTTARQRPLPVMGGGRKSGKQPRTRFSGIPPGAPRRDLLGPTPPCLCPTSVSIQQIFDAIARLTDQVPSTLQTARGCGLVADVGRCEESGRCTAVRKTACAATHMADIGLAARDVPHFALCWCRSPYRSTRRRGRPWRVRAAKRRPASTFGIKSVPIPGWLAVGSTRARRTSFCDPPGDMQWHSPSP